MEHLKVGEFIDIGNGPQEVRFVKVQIEGRFDDTTYELARPNGKTPLQTVGHRYIERLYRAASRNSGQIGIREIAAAGGYR